MQQHKEDYQALADRYAQYAPEFKLIECISDHRLRNKLHRIYCQKFISQYKQKGTKPSDWDVSSARYTNDSEQLDPGGDMLLLLDLLTLGNGKLYCPENK